VILYRSVFNVVVAGLVALIVAAIVPWPFPPLLQVERSERASEHRIQRNLRQCGTPQDGLCEGEPFVREGRPASGGTARRAPVLHDMDGDGIDEAAVLLAKVPAERGVHRSGRRFLPGRPGGQRRTTGLGNRS